MQILLYLDMAKTLAEWLIQDCNCFDVQPVRVTIGNETREGCRYKQTFEYQPGMDAVSRGHKKAGDTYTEESIYLIGELPSCYIKNLTRSGDIHQRQICFPFEDVDWYIAGYMLKKHLTPSNQEFHPFGVHFMLRPWCVPDGAKIDKYETKPYIRVKMILLAQNEQNRSY
jgi:hypothetical protein